MGVTRIADLELDLDVFAGPFDLLLSLVLREELDLLEVDLAEVVVSYLDHLETTLRLADEVVRHKLIRLPDHEATKRGLFDEQAAPAETAG